MQGEQVLQGVRDVSSRWLGGGECPLRGFARPGVDVRPRVRIGVQWWLVQCPRIELLPVRIAWAERRVGGHRILPNRGHERATADGHSTAVSDRRAEVRKRGIPALQGRNSDAEATR
jgi:hypothetical protein